MSLLDTIKAARQEAEDAGTLLGSSKKDEAAPVEEAKDSDKPRSSVRRSSAASAKPARELAGSVRTSSEDSKPKKEMTREEKRAARVERRKDEDIVYDAKKAVLEAMPEYKHTQRVWWGMLIAGIAFTLVSWGAMHSIDASQEGSGSIALLSASLMVIAYILVIGAFIYDLVKVRPLRNKADQQLTGMSRRRMVKLVEEDERRKAEEKANAKK